MKETFTFGAWGRRFRRFLYGSSFLSRVLNFFPSSFSNFFLGEAASLSMRFEGVWTEKFSVALIALSEFRHDTRVERERMEKMTAEEVERGAIGRGFLKFV